MRRCVLWQWDRKRNVCPPGQLIAIRGCVVDEVVLPESPGSLPNLRQGEVGADPLVLDGGDVLDGAVLGVPGHLMRPQLPAEARAPQEIDGRLVLLHLRRGNQRD